MPRDAGSYRLSRANCVVLSEPFFLGAADLAYEDYNFSLQVLQEHLVNILEVETRNRAFADTHRSRDAETSCCEPCCHLIG